MDLQQGMSRSGMHYDELWLEQVALGGSAGRLEVEAYVLGLLTADPYQHDLLAQALNERFLEHDQDHPVEYWIAAATE
jgi:hypothetical protein